MKNQIFNSYGVYYDLLYSDKNYLNEVEYIKQLLYRFGINKGDILEFGSGTGKHGILLSKDSFTVHGIELSEKMVAKANAKKEKNFSCQQGDIAFTKMDRKYNAVISLFHVISYQTTKNQLNAVFLNASNHLNIGGLFIFDFWFSPAVFMQKPSVRVKRMKDKKFEITRIAEPKTFNHENCVDVNYTIYVKEIETNIIKCFKETHPMRHFSLLEFDILSDLHGFERINSEEFLTGNQLSEETWGACVVLKKIKKT